jgi:hypothetical protein
MISRLTLTADWRRCERTISTTSKTTPIHQSIYLSSIIIETMSNQLVEALKNKASSEQVE